MHIYTGNTLGMTTTFPSINISMYKNKILDFLDELKTRILTKESDKTKELDKYQYASIIDTQTLNKEDLKYAYITQTHSILESVNKIAIMLKKEPLLTKEFFVFLEIQQITEYLLKNQDYTKPNVDAINFIRRLFEEFLEVISIKADLFGDIDSEDQVTNEMLSKYEPKYASFEDVFSKHKERFYLEMYTPSNKHNETINNLYAIMKE